MHPEGDARPPYRSSESAPLRAGFWTILILPAILAAIAYVTIESVQRRNFALLSHDVGMAMAEIHWRTGPDRFVTQEATTLDHSRRIRAWEGCPTRNGPPSSHPPNYFRVEVVQKRDWVLRSPTIEVLWSTTRDPEVADLVLGF
jgi:hypothetical protein